VTPEENVKYWETLLGTAAKAASDVSSAMAKTMQERVQNVELRKISHSPGMFWKAFPGQPPAYVTGNLARSIQHTVALPFGTVAISSVFTDSIYGGIQEFGGYTWGNHGMMHWRNSRGSWWMKSVLVPEHPYFRPALEAITRDGSLQGSAISAFMKHMSPIIR
jgi:hypothetical protein